MPKKYMSQSIYDSAVSTIGFLHDRNHIPVEDLITKLRVTYDDSIIDDGVWDDIAAITIKYLFYADGYFKKKQENSLSYYDREKKMLNFFEDYKEHCLAYRSDGKKKGFFSGIIFMKSEKIDNKEENFFKRTEKFLEQKF